MITFTSNPNVKIFRQVHRAQKRRRPVHKKINMRARLIPRPPGPHRDLREMNCLMDQLIKIQKVLDLPIPTDRARAAMVTR